MTYPYQGTGHFLVKMINHVEKIAGMVMPGRFHGTRASTESVHSSIGKWIETAHDHFRGFPD